ncbi:MAG: hypothetical protein QOH89_968, partial [Pseudonocardiales bacterium]|nr:hypothetical protein [Pseudonocardiales bacterium]
LLPIHAANAEPRVGPPLGLQLILYKGPSGEDERGSLSVSGRGCLPQDAPASVMVTLDRAPGEVFTAKPDASGRWYLDIDIDLPIDGIYVVNATCDNYFGETVYPEARTDADHILVAVPAASGGSGSGAGGAGGPPIEDGGVANTGPRTMNELALGLGAVVLGLLLVGIGRPRRALARVPGQHRRS